MIIKELVKLVKYESKHGSFKTIFGRTITKQFNLFRIIWVMKAKGHQVILNTESVRTLSHFRLKFKTPSTCCLEILKITQVNKPTYHTACICDHLLSLCAYVHHVKMMEFPMKYVKQIVHAYLQPHLKTSWNCFKIISSSRQLSFQSWTCEYIRLVHGTFCCRAPEQGG